MNRLPARHQQHTAPTCYEFNITEGSVHAVPLEPFSVRGNALTLVFTASWLIALACVTIGVLTS